MPSILDDGSNVPDESSLADALGEAKTAWDELVEHLRGCPGVVSDWKFYGKKHGWQLEAAKGKRAVLTIELGT